MRNRIWFWLSAVFTVMALFQLYHLAGKITAGNKISHGAVSWYSAGLLAGEKQDLYDVRLHRERAAAVNPGTRPFYVNPPLLAVIISFFGSDIHSFQYFLLVSKILLLMMISVIIPYFLIYRTKYLDYTPVKSHFFRMFAILFFIIVSLKPVYTDLVSGQLAVYFLFLLALGMVFLPGSQLRSGLFTGFGLFLKTGTMFVALFYLVFRMRRALFSFLVTAGGLAAVSLSYYGPEIHLKYLKRILLPFVGRLHLPQMEWPVSQGLNQSINGLLSRLFMNEYVNQLIETRPVIDSPVVFTLLSLVFTYSLILYTSFVIWRSRPFMEKRQYLAYIGYALFIALIPLVSPVTLNSDLVITIIPISILLNEFVRKQDYISGAITVLFVLLYYYEPLNIHRDVGRFASLAYLRLFANLVVYRGVLRLLKKYSV